MERKAEYCLTQIFHYLVNGLAAIVFFCCIAYSGYALWDNWSILKEPDQVREDLIRYKPANEEELSYSFQELKAMNPDVCGWLTLDHTKIDYPVVQEQIILSIWKRMCLEIHLWQEVFFLMQNLTETFMISIL